MNQAQQPEAIQLARFFESMQSSSHRWHDGTPVHEKAAAELRRLHGRVQELEAALVKEAARTASEKTRADQMSLQHDAQAALNREARALLAAKALQSEELERDHSDEDAAIAAGKVQAAVQGRVG